jgi:glycosyltransferase involved in cell wall biosynthesis
MVNIRAQNMVGTDDDNPRVICPAHVPIVTFTTLYPSVALPNHGVFVENRLRHLVSTGAATAQVVSPVPWFPFRNGAFGRYATLARVPAREIRHGIAIEHPRYPVIPKLGMWIAPDALVAGTRRWLARNRSQFDLIDAHYFYPDGVAAARIGQWLGKPVVITARGSDINLIARSPVPRKMIIRAGQSASALIAVSGALKNSLVALGLPQEKIAVLRNGVDLNMFSPADREAARQRCGIRGRTLLSVGNLVELKGHDLMLRALEALTDYELLIVGEGPELKRLRTLADSLGVQTRVRFLGSVPHMNLRDIYVACDALVVASSREGWPNVVLEALACGTPVIATPVGGIPEILTSPDAGILLKARTPEALSQAVKQLFQSPPARQKTRLFAEQFSWDATSLGQLRVFEEILANGSFTSG